MAERVRQTRQGQAVLNVVAGSDNFRSAQDIHAELRAAGETVGLTTVYRHLALLTDEGRLDALQTADGELVYRRCHSEQHHHHPWSVATADEAPRWSCPDWSVGPRPRPRIWATAT